jgi:hypothetical protein
MRIAFSRIVSNTRLRLSGDELMMRNTSIAAVCCRRDSESSRLSRAMSDSLPADEPRGRVASLPLARFDAADLRLRDLTGPALERRLIALPKAQGKAL